MWFGPDASTLGTTPAAIRYHTAIDVAIRQAYITLRTPVGNGIDWKIGVFDTIIGYESTSTALNPNYTHSYGYTMEPTTHTGLLATYKFCDAFSATVGMADSKGPIVNDRSPQANGASDSLKTYMGSITLTAPSSWGWASGASLSAGVVNGIYSNQPNLANTVTANDTTTSWYVGGTLPTPNSNLKLGASFDYDDCTTFRITHGRWQAMSTSRPPPKLSLNGRIEWAKNYLGIVEAAANPNNPALPGEQNAVALTGTLQYNLWANVLTRLEVRWDHASYDIYGGNVSGGGTSGAGKRSHDCVTGCLSVLIRLKVYQAPSGTGRGFSLFEVRRHVAFPGPDGPAVRASRRSPKAAGMSAHSITALGFLHSSANNSPTKCN